MTVSAYTPNFKLALIDFNSQNWNGDTNANLTLIDAILKANFAAAPFAVATGTNALTLTYSPSLTGYVSGQTILFKLAASPTGAMTLNANGLGVKNLLLAGANVVTGDLQAGDVVRALYDGTQFNVLEPTRVFSSVRVRSAAYGGTGAATTVDDLIIENNVSAGISILTPSTAVGSIAFGHPGAALAGILSYDHSLGRMTLSAENSFYAGVVCNFGTTTATNFVGPLAGNVTGNLTGNVTGNVSGTAGGLSIILPIANGGTGAVTAAAARTALGLGTLATAATVDNTVWSGTALSIANGGTGATTAVAALTALGAYPLSYVVIQTQAGAVYTGFVDNMISLEY